MRSVLLIRCLPKMPPSSSTSTSSQTACNLEEILDMNNGATSAAILYHRRRGRCSSDHRRFLSEPGSARYSSTPSYLTIRKYSTTSLKLKSISLKNGDFFTKCANGTLTSLTLKLQITWPVILRSHWSVASQLTYTVTMTIRSSTTLLSCVGFHPEIRTKLAHVSFLLHVKYTILYCI